MYAWVTDTWNAIKGRCPHDCSYCYMKRFGEQKPARFDAKELKTDLQSGKTIFVGSSCDMFAADIPAEWIRATLDHCRKYPGNRYIFQSKNPGRMVAILAEYPTVDAVVGTTIESNRFFAEFMGAAPDPLRRGAALSLFPGEKFVTIEPVLDFDVEELFAVVKMSGAKFVNIGADSGNNGLKEPPSGKVFLLIDALTMAGIQVRQKRNLSRLTQ
jgi:protein gp37